MAVFENGVLRWYIRFQAQHAEKAFSAKVLIDAIDESYEYIERAPALIQGARKDLMEEMGRTAFALEPSVNVEKFAMGQFAYTRDDQALVHQRMVGNISKARKRAKAINTVRFIHLLEAKALQGGFAVPPEAPVASVSRDMIDSDASEVEVDVIGRFDKLPLNSEASELEVDVIGRFEKLPLNSEASELEVDVIARFEELRQGVRIVPEHDNSAVSTEVSEYY